MPIDYSFEDRPSFRDLTEAGLGLIRQPFTRSLRKLNDLRAKLAGTEPTLARVSVKAGKRFRRSS